MAVMIRINRSQVDSVIYREDEVLQEKTLQEKAWVIEI